MAAHCENIKPASTVGHALNDECRCAGTYLGHWTQLLSQARDEAERGCTKAAFDKAFNALELCYGICADARDPKNGAADAKAFNAFRKLLVDGKITRDEWEVADHLRQARNVVTHKFGFETTLRQARLSIDLVRKLCTKFAGLIRDVMVREVVTASPHESAHDYVQLMRDRGFSQFPVVDESGACIGTLDERTVLDAIFSGKCSSPDGCRVLDVMRRELLPVIDETATLVEARQRMIDEGISAYVVLDSCLRVRGLITKFELIR